MAHARSAHLSPLSSGQGSACEHASVPDELSWPSAACQHTFHYFCPCHHRATDTRDRKLKGNADSDAFTQSSVSFKAEGSL